MTLISGFLVIFVLSGLQNLISRIRGVFWIVPIPFIFLLGMVYAYSENYIESLTKLVLLSVFGVLLLAGEGIRTKNKKKEQRKAEMEKMKKRDI